MYTEFFILIFAFLDVYKYLKLFNFCHFFYNFLFIAGTLKFAFPPKTKLYNLCIVWNSQEAVSSS